MDKYDVLKSVIFRTKSFKALIIIALIFGCFVLQFSNNTVPPEHRISTLENVQVSNYEVKSENFEDFESEKSVKNDELFSDQRDIIDLDNDKPKSVDLESFYETNKPDSEPEKLTYEDSILNDDIPKVAEEKESINYGKLNYKRKLFEK